LSIADRRDDRIGGRRRGRGQLDFGSDAPAIGGSLVPIGQPACSPDNQLSGAMKRHAEIAGAGIAGLSCANMLARRGWTVRIHERSPEIRELGTGIQIKNNAIEVLEEFGLFDRLAPLGFKLERSHHRDPDGRLMQERTLAGKSRVYVFLRQPLIEVLRIAAEEAGVEIVTSSRAVAADPTGELVLESGRRLRADLVIAADGAQSKLREALDIGGSHRPLSTVVNRYLVPSREITPEPITTEHWSGRYRVGIMPCGSDLSFVFQVFPEWDRSAMALPIDRAFWTKAFPRLRREIDMLSQTEALQHNFSIVRCPRWHKGRVAIIGDAAHGLPPTLGQGAGLTLMNAHALALALDRNRTVEEALPAWETAVRFVSDKTQCWAMRYDFLTRQWPEPLWFLRAAIIWAFRLPALNRRMRIADQGLKLAALQSLDRAS
jgi:2-polyprenyl-6-methoxyphenol hydroxylase-like FAD-dependent oxidoreductase